MREGGGGGGETMGLFSGWQYYDCEYTTYSQSTNIRGEKKKREKKTTKIRFLIFYISDKNSMIC